MKTITLTSLEERALREVLLDNHCRSACAFSEMQRSSKDCRDCSFEKAITSIFEKLTAE